MKTKSKYPLLIPVIIMSPYALADKPGSYLGAGITAIYQHANDSRINNELWASFDITAKKAMGKGEWYLYVEGNKSPRTAGVSSVIGEANFDAGSALDQNGKGRFQVSELHYTLPLGKGRLQAGLLYVPSNLDNSDVANSELNQFLSATLVNNPTIEFPDYTLGMSWKLELGENKPSYNFVLASSHGLSNNPNKSYSELFKVDESGKGVFAAAELTMPLAGTAFRLGAWTNTSDHTYLDGSSGTTNNYGLYTSIDGEFSKTKWNLRLGMANDKVSEAANFIGLAMERSFDRITMGAGITRTGLSDKVTTAGKDDRTQAEIYAKYELHKGLFISPSVQYIKNSGFDSSGSSFRQNLNVYSLRLQYDL